MERNLGVGPSGVWVQSQCHNKHIFNCIILSALILVVPFGHVKEIISLLEFILSVPSFKPICGSWLYFFLYPCLPLTFAMSILVLVSWN